MKRILSILFAVLILAGCFSFEHVSASVLPKDESKYDIESFKENAYHNYRRFMDEPGGWNCLTNYDAYGYTLYVEKLKSDIVAQASLETAEFLTNKGWSDFFTGNLSNDDVKVRYYITALSNLLMTMEENMADFRVSQAKATTSKTFFDYAIDAAKITASYMAKIAGGNNDDAWATAFDLCGSSIGILGDSLNSVQRLEALQLNADKYVSYRGFLDVLNKNSNDKYLTEASDTFIKALDKIYNYRMAHFEDWADIAIEAQSDQFFSVLEKVIEEAEKDGEAFEDIGCLKLINVIAKGVGSFKLGVDIGKFIGDVFIKSSDHIQRYYEMCAMVACRDALISVIKSNDSKVKSKDDIELLNDNVALCRDMNYVNARGAYCAYSIMTKDVGLFSKIYCLFNGETTEEWIKCVGQICNSLDIHLQIIIPNLDYYELDDKDGYNDVIEEYQNVIARLKSEDKESFINNLKNEYGFVNQDILKAASNYYNFGGTANIEAYGENYGKQEFIFYYAIYDINGDGTNELVLGGGSTPDHIVGRATELYGGFVIFDIFTNCDGMVKSLIIDPEAEFPIIIYKDGIIDYSGDNYSTVYNMTLPENSDSLVLVAKYYSEDGIYFATDSNGAKKEISFEEFNSVYLPGKEKLSLQWERIDNGDVEKNDLTIKECYISVLNNEVSIAKTKEKYYAPKYLLYDINKDGTPELIVRSFTTYKFYTISYNQSLRFASYTWAYDNCIYEYGGNGLLVYDGGMGSYHSEYVNIYTMENNSLNISDELINSAENSYDDIQDFLKGYKQLSDFFDAEDLSGLQILK